MSKTIVRTTKTFIQIQDGNGEVREVEIEDDREMEEIEEEFYLNMFQSWYPKHEFCPRKGAFLCTKMLFCAQIALDIFWSLTLFLSQNKTHTFPEEKFIFANDLALFIFRKMTVFWLKSVLSFG